MFDRHKGIRQVVADFYGRGIGVVELRILGLQCAQFAHQRIEFVVGNFRSVVYAIKIFVARNFFTQTNYLLFRLYFFHKTNSNLY